MSLLPTLGDQILHQMNIEEGWAKLQETRKLEKIEAKLRKEREVAALLKEEQDALNQLQDTTSESVVMVEHESSDDKSEDKLEDKSEEDNKQEDGKHVEKHVEKPAEKHTEKPAEIESSVGSLATSFIVEEDIPLPAGILSKKEKNLLWDEIKTMS